MSARARQAPARRGCVAPSEKGAALRACGRWEASLGIPHVCICGVEPVILECRSRCSDAHKDPNNNAESREQEGMAPRYAPPLAEDPRK